jgi:hypothetical protein
LRNATLAEGAVAGQDEMSGKELGERCPSETVRCIIDPAQGTQMDILVEPHNIEICFGKRKAFL